MLINKSIVGGKKGAPLTRNWCVLLVQVNGDNFNWTGLIYGLVLFLLFTTCENSNFLFSKRNVDVILSRGTTLFGCLFGCPVVGPLWVPVVGPLQVPVVGPQYLRLECTAHYGGQQSPDPLHCLNHHQLPLK